MVTRFFARLRERPLLYTTFAAALTLTSFSYSAFIQPNQSAPPILGQDATNYSSSSAPLVIHNDQGGLIGKRSREVRGLADSGRRVELRGNCYSACTLYLQLANTCVTPSARFGFHGPSWYGSPLPADKFEHWSKILASAYREPLRTWFMTDFRYNLRDLTMLSGADLINMGYQRC